VLIGQNSHPALCQKLFNQTDDFCIVLLGVDELRSQN
jgi:hypothetical protein